MTESEQGREKDEETASFTAEPMPVETRNSSLDRLRQPGDTKAVLEDLLRNSEAIHDVVRVFEVEGVGWEIYIGQNEPGFQGNDWVLYDLDDSLVAYSGAKPARQEEYETYLQESGMGYVDRDTAIAVMNMTDEFSRWAERGREMYHLGAHMQALAWATRQLRQADRDQPADVTLRAMRESLGRMADARDQDAELGEDDPFTIQDGKLVGRPGMSDLESLDDVFKPMLEPTPYDDVLDSMHQIRTHSQEQPPPDVGILTYGEPAFQLAKTVALMEYAARRGKPLPISRILLTTAPKGDFIGEMAFKAARHGENWSPYFNAIRPHSLLLVDDNPDELTSFEDLNHYVMARSRTGIANLRLHHDPDAKTANGEWQDNPRRTQFFPRMTYERESREPLADQILQTLYLARREVEEWDRYGHPQYFDDFDGGGEDDRYVAA